MHAVGIHTRCGRRGGRQLRYVCLSAQCAGGSCGEEAARTPDSWWLGFWIRDAKQARDEDAPCRVRCASVQPPPPPLSVNDRKLTEPTPSVAWTRVLLMRYTVTWYMRKDMVCSSENQGATYATQAIIPQSASLTQNMNIVRLKAQVSDTTRSTRQGQLKNAPPKSTVRKVTEPTRSVAWAQALLGHKQWQVQR